LEAAHAGAFVGSSQRAVSAVLVALLFLVFFLFRRFGF